MARAPKLLFENAFMFFTEGATAEKSKAYDVSPDGQRFYFILQENKGEHEAKLNLILNWSDELTRLAPARKER